MENRYWWKYYYTSMVYMVKSWANILHKKQRMRKKAMDYMLEDSSMWSLGVVKIRNVHFLTFMWSSQVLPYQIMNRDMLIATYIYWWGLGGGLIIYDVYLKDRTTYHVNLIWVCLCLMESATTNASSVFTTHF